MRQVNRSIKPRPKLNNLSANERTTLIELKNRTDLSILPSDKGGEFCVVNRDTYINTGIAQLQDRTVYRPVPRMTARTVETKVNKVWKGVAAERSLPKYITRSYTATNTDIPEFYHLIKTHKPRNQTLKSRPIVPNIGSPTNRIAWLLSRLLKPLLRHIPAHLDSSRNLMSEIANLTTEDIKQYKYPCSLDVVSLYTSIPPHEASCNIIDLIALHGVDISPFEPVDISRLLQAIHQNVYFTFNGQVYQQVSGLPMGSSVSAIAAITFMHKIESAALYQLGSSFVSTFKRYMDDCFSAVKNEEDADRLLSVFNEQHPNIKFELEKPTHNNQLSLLDFTVLFSSTGGATFSFYKKCAKKPIFVHSNSAIPDQQKMAIIRNERHRIQERCTDAHDQSNNQAAFDVILTNHGYSSTTIHRSRRPLIKRRPSQQNDPHREVLYLRTPYVSDSLDYSIRKIYEREGLNVRITHRSHTLRQELNSNKKHAQCSMEGCSMRNKLCYRKNVVYSMKCSICSAQYVGCTVRHLHQRVREHLTGPESAIHGHLQYHVGATWNIEVIASERDIVDLRIAEALHISRRKPALNSKDEIKDMAQYIFS